MNQIGALLLYCGFSEAIVSQLISGHELVGYDLNFFYLDLTNTALIRCIRTDRATYAVFCQAEDREFDRVHAVFDAMTTSLLSNLRPLGPSV